MPNRELAISEQAIRLLNSHSGEGGPAEVVSVPGRINLIGEHIDYHDLPVLPMAISRRVSIAFRVRTDGRVRAVSTMEIVPREFTLAPQMDPGPPGDWANYLKAAAVAVATRWPIVHGIEAAIASDLPVAAGLSSSSAVLAGFALALLKANEIHPTVEDLMTVLPDGEHFVGTRGGGMDHAAVLAARRGCALLVNFAPLGLQHVKLPGEWSFLVAHSLSTAEKSGALRAKYNVLREHGRRALQATGAATFQEAVAYSASLPARAPVTEAERQVFSHVLSEASRVRLAVAAVGDGDAAGFGGLLLASHASLRDNLGVSTPAIDDLVTAAVKAGALGARLTGAGFGGCVIALCTSETCDQVRERLVNGYYSGRHDFDAARHLFVAEPSDGALAA